VNLMPCGDVGLLVEVEDIDHVLALADVLRADTPAGVLDIVPATCTVLLTVEPGTDLGALRRIVQQLDVRPGAAAADGRTVEIPVTYDGPDLAEVAELTGLGVDGVVDAHTGTLWRVAFGGFAPGFAYLVDGDPRLNVSRRAEPRTTVPAGSVGLAGQFSGVYPRSSPGGWQLIGRTGTELWDLDSGAVLQPGGLVRFVASDG
jgi:KipI family sensor histidine kinase inhibitor